MKGFLKVIALGFVLLGVSAYAQVILQGFSNVADGSSNFFYGTWEATGNTGGTVSPNANFSQGAGVYNFTGSSGIIPTNSATSFVEFFNASPVSIGTNTSLSVTAHTLPGNASSSFTVFLLDTSGNSAYAAYDASFFITGSYSTATVQLTTVGAFNPASIDSLRISGNQPGGSSAFGFSFDNISAVSAVPEPSTYALFFGLSGLLVAAWHRRTAHSMG